MKNKLKDIDYKTYLQLPALLGTQRPLSTAHDEWLFITVHQTYELWFRQIIIEMDRVQSCFARATVEDRDLRQIVSGLNRIFEILQHLVRQVDLLETMTPLDFLDFRQVFRTASGFQSMQFREIETRLGLRASDRAGFGGKPYDSYLSEEDRALVAALEKKASLFDQVDQWLSRTPFIAMDGFDFWKSYRRAVDDMLAADRKSIMANESFGDAARTLELNKLEQTQRQFDAFFAADREKGRTWRLSDKAVQAALMIALYRDQPALQVPFEILSALMDIDETMANWRHRHALMAQRMLGMKVGSGGSSGHDYLAETVSKNRIFSDLFALSTFMIPRTLLPALPEEVERRMGFRYGG